MRRIFGLYRHHFNFWKTIYLNFKVFNFKDACKLPILIYGRIDFEGLYNGCIELRKVEHNCVRMGGGTQNCSVSPIDIRVFSE